MGREDLQGQGGLGELLAQVLGVKLQGGVKLIRVREDRITAAAQGVGDLSAGGTAPLGLVERSCRGEHAGDVDPGLLLDGVGHPADAGRELLQGELLLPLQLIAGIDSQRDSPAEGVDKGIVCGKKCHDRTSIVRVGKNWPLLFCSLRVYRWPTPHRILLVRPAQPPRCTVAAHRAQSLVV